MQTQQSFYVRNNRTVCHQDWSLISQLDVPGNALGLQLLKRCTGIQQQSDDVSNMFHRTLIFFVTVTGSDSCFFFECLNFTLFFSHRGDFVGTQGVDHGAQAQPLAVRGARLHHGAGVLWHVELVEAEIYNQVTDKNG